MSERKNMENLTPPMIVATLDEYIIKQDDAKRAVAVAMRNRWRRQNIKDAEMRDEVMPKNIIMAGPTGVGKTEIARRMAKIVNAPFTKVEASKFTEVGYVGKDVESMIRDLVEVSVRIEKEAALELVRPEAQEDALTQVALNLLPADAIVRTKTHNLDGTEAVSEPSIDMARLEALKKAITDGEYDDKKVTIEVPETQVQTMDTFGMGGMSTSMMSGGPPKTIKRTLPTRTAIEKLSDVFAEEKLDMGAVYEDALNNTEQNGIVFLDEIDKIIGNKNVIGVDVSRSGVQRDLLPIVEGSTVATRYGHINTDHILFVAAGAFSDTDPSDMIPELQGRFPVKARLENLTKEDFVRILTEPKNSLTKQYTALMETEGIELVFSDEAINMLASIAERVNKTDNNIGARRLHTVMERLLEELSFNASERGDDVVVKYDAAMVEEILEGISEDQDLTVYSV